MDSALRESLKARLRALEIAHASVTADPDEARAAMRRIGESLAVTAASAGDAALERSARELANAHKTATATKRARSLIQALRGLLGGSASAQRVLLIDDDRLLVAVLRDALQGSDLELSVARSMGEAQALLEREEFALILLDLVLPDGDGRRLLMRLRAEERTRRTPIVVLTAKQGAQAMSESLALGADAFVEKPIDPAGLSSLIHNQLLHHSSGQPSQPEPPPRRVLLVEEDELLAQLLSHRFQRDDWEVACYHDGKAALEELNRQRYAVAILDLRSPGADGHTLLRALRAASPGTPVILLSEVGGEDEVVRVFRDGADDFLLKPISPSELMARVNRLVPHTS